MEDFEDYSIGARAELGMALVLERRYNSTEYGNGYTQCYSCNNFSSEKYIAALLHVSILTVNSAHDNHVLIVV